MSVMLTKTEASGSVWCVLEGSLASAEAKPSIAGL
jgi:hypothetical protein